MKFSKETMKLLSACAEGKIMLNIEGANAFGQPFKITGCIMPDKTEDGKVVFITPHGLGLYVGQTFLNRDKKECKQYVGLYANPDEEFSSGRMYIDTISTAEGTLLFKNGDFDRIIRKSQLVNAREHNFVEDEFPEYAKQLMSFIGKPVVLYGDKERESVVVKGFSMTRNGNLYATCTTGLLEQHCPIYSDDTIECDNDASDRLEEFTRMQENEIG